jgi:hypothetical protein
MNRPWKVILAFALVFVAGAIFGGALAPRWLRLDLDLQNRPPFTERVMKRLDQELSLTDAQRAGILPIVERMAEETQRMRRDGVQTYRTVMDGYNAEIALQLTPEQRTKLEEMRKRFRERMDRVRQRRGE